MPSRRSRLHERRLKRRAFLLILASLALLLLLLFLGIPALVRFAVFVGELRQSSISIVQEDKIPPPPPFINPLPAYTNERDIKVAGSAEVASTLTLFVNGEAEKETLIDDTGTFSLGVGLAEGENKISATATDSAGNESDISQVQVVIYDTQPPTLEVNEPADGEKFFGDQNTITIKGKTEADARVTINDRLAILGPEGEFSQTVSLAEGDNTFTIKAQDPAGNETEKEVTVSYSQ